LLGTRTIAVLMAVLIVAAMAATAADEASGPPSSPTAQAGSCESQAIAGRHRCTLEGRYCTHTALANRDYHRYGSHCGQRDGSGSYRLVSR
jgi:hypothetical protein